MVSTIANGGVYLPPHVLMPEQIELRHCSQPKGCRTAGAAASPFKPGGDLPNPLPAGAHRVISTLTAAQMRKMMEGVVLFGTGKAAQLNGYSSGGKTGTAQKIDPATHTYSKTMHIASFAGFAPVNNPVIAVAVVIDSPKGAYYGAAGLRARSLPRWRSRCSNTSACRTTSICGPRPPPPKKNLPVKEDDAGTGREYSGPLRSRQRSAQRRSAARRARCRQTHNRRRLPKLLAPMRALNPAHRPATPLPCPRMPLRGRRNPLRRPRIRWWSPMAGQMRVPSPLGLSVRQVIEQAGSSGLEVEIAGSGTAREQAPTPGAMVAPGTKIVVRCAR